MGPLGPHRPCSNAALLGPHGMGPRGAGALAGRALVGPLGPSSAVPLRDRLCPCGFGPCGPPWALVGQAPMGPWALAGHALVGPLMGPLGL